jgi:glycerol kinase
VIEQLIVEAKLDAKECAGIGITNQRETTVVWNRRSGAPVYKAIVWQDTRVNDTVSKYISHGVQDQVRALTGLPLASYFSALKLQWVLDNAPGARAAAEAGELCFGTIDAWLIWNLTGGAHLTDVTNACRTQLMNLATLDWDDELLALFRIPRSVLPRIVSSSLPIGQATTTSLKGVPIAGILGDQQAALVGQACFRPGEAKNTYGTGCFMLLNTGEQAVASKAGLLTTLAYRFGSEKPCYALEGSIAIAGALVQWLRDNLQLIATSADVESLARSVDDNGDVYIVPAFSGLYAPYWREDARGVIAGLTRFANRGHIARAALEAVAYQVRDVLDAMEKDSGIEMSELRVDGGMVANELLMQFQSDVLNVPVVRPAVTETTALGAAYAAGLATGVWRNREELRSQWREAKRWSPAMPEAVRERLYGSWQKAVQRSLGWVAR